MKIGNRERALIGIVAALALCGAFYVLVLTPQRHTAARLQTQLATAQTQLTSAQEAYQTGHAAAVALSKDAPSWHASNIAVPESSNVPAMLRLLQRSAEEVHVTVETISLSASSAAATAATPTTGGGTSGSAPSSVPVSLTFTGGYQALRRLVNRLDQYVVVSKNGLQAYGPLFGIGDVSVNPGSGKVLTIQLTTDLYQRTPYTVAAGSSSGGS